MGLQSTFALVKPACDMAGVISADASVGVVEGRMEAHNRHMLISQPCDLPDFNVPVVDLDFALRRYDDPEMKLTDANLILEGKSRVKRMPERKPNARSVIETHEIDPTSLLAAFQDILPFTIGDPARPWSEGARIDGDTITATNSTMLCQATLDHGTHFEGVTLSRPLIKYILQRGHDLKAWGVSEKGILLSFKDGGWVQGYRMTAEMPDAAVSLLDKAVTEWGDLRECDDDYKAAFLRAGAWSTDVLTVFPDKIYAGRYSSEHDEPAETNMDCPDGAMFTAKNIAAVMERAASIGFDRFPSPVPFTTTFGSRGLIAGRV